MNSDKERIIEEENAAKVPRTEVYTKKIIHTTQKPWFWQSCGVCLGLVALMISLAALIAFMGWRTYVRPNYEDELPIDTRDSDEYLMRKACYQPKVLKLYSIRFHLKCCQYLAISANDMD